MGDVSDRAQGWKRNEMTYTSVNCGTILSNFHQRDERGDPCEEDHEAIPDDNDLSPKNENKLKVGKQAQTTTS